MGRAQALLFGLLTSCAHASPPAPAPIVVVTPPSADVTEAERLYVKALVDYARDRLEPPRYSATDGAYALGQFEDGQRAYEAEDWRGAYEHFRNACQVTHAPVLYRNMAYALSHFDRLSAYTFLLEYLNRTALSETPSRDELADRLRVIGQLTRFRAALDGETAAGDAPINLIGSQ